LKEVNMSEPVSELKNGKILRHKYHKRKEYKNILLKTKIEKNIKNLFKKQ